MTDHRILNPGSNCWDICEANKTGLLVDARDYYYAFYQAANIDRKIMPKSTLMNRRKRGKPGA